jgi:CYTH domain-containing protein
MIEREKRWNLKPNTFIPTDAIKDKFTITQTYAESQNPQVRIRKISRDSSDEFYHTVKYQLKNKTEREEIEQKISKERYERIFDVIDKKPVVKERTIVDIGDGLIAEIDEFEDGNIVIEVEFDKVEIMQDFVKPDWFGEEIKSNKSFSYKVFAKINNINISIWD